MATYLGYQFYPELFSYNWQNERDPVLTALYDSGAVVANGQIQELIQNGSNIYEIPIYKPLGGDPDLYNGVADITVSEPEAGSQVGVVYGRAHAWSDKDFIRDFNSGADPMRQIVSGVARYWQKQRQATFLAVLGGLFGLTDTEWLNHTTNIASASATVAASNKLADATIAEAAQKGLGDSSGTLGLAIMHSAVAKNLSVLNLLEYRKYTDPSGIERTLNIADANGLTVVVDDGVPTTPAGSAAATYTTYLFGQGALHYAPAPVSTPVELKREALESGGYNALVTRLRETIHPNGFSWKGSGTTADDIGAANSLLGTSAKWEIVTNTKNLPIVQIVSNG